MPIIKEAILTDSYTDEQFNPYILVNERLNPKRIFSEQF